MSIKISKNNSSPYDYFSEGDGSDPIAREVTVDGSGGDVNSSSVTIYVVATDNNYTGITVESINNETGLTWSLSKDNTNFSQSISLSDMDATTNDVTTTIYARVTVANDGSRGAGVYTGPDIRINYTEST